MDKKEFFVGEPVQVGADLFMRMCAPVVHEARKKVAPTPQQLGQLYAGFIGACVGSMIGVFGHEQAIEWAQQTLDLVARKDFEALTKPGGIHERKGH